MKCIICGDKAEYMYLGNSYCEKHKNDHAARMKALIIKEQKEDICQKS